MKHRNDVDGLRAVAVIPVLLFHFGLAWLPGGFTGVDIFFVISGFVIASSIGSDCDRGTFSVLNFYFKRIRRIFPALLAVLTVTTIASAMILLPPDFADYGRSLSATATFLSNFYFWKASGYFQPTAQTQPLLHTWSLSVEEQFYVFAPIVFALIHCHARQRWLWVIAPAFLISLGISIAAAWMAPTAGFYLLPSRAWELLLGAALALRNRPVTWGAPLREAAAAAGLALIAAGMLLIHETDPFPAWNALLPCVGTALIIHAGLNVPAGRLTVVGRILGTRPFTWIGLISYSLYLVHWPIVALAHYQTLRTPSAIEAVGLLIASIALAWLSWRFIEQPFRHVGLEKRARVLLAGVAMIAVVVGVGTTIRSADGWPRRFPEFVQRTIPGVEDWGGGRCFNMDAARQPDWEPANCTRIRGTGGRILLWGDSFAAHYTPGILRDATRIDADVLQYTFAGCPPILAYQSLGRVGCAPFNKQALALIRAQHIDTVVIAARWVDTPKATVAQLADTVAAVRRLGARVIVIGQTPVFAADVQGVDYLLGHVREAGLVAAPAVPVAELNRALAEQARRGGATFVNPTPVLCPADRCAYRNGATYFYADAGHFSRTGSIMAVRAFFPPGRRVPSRR